MIVVKPEAELRPQDLMERVVLDVLQRHGRVEARRLSKDADKEREVRFVVSPDVGAEAVQVEAHAASRERGKQLPGSIALFGATAAPSDFARAVADLLASIVGGYVWEPDPRDTERLTLPDIEDMRGRRRGVRKSVEGTDAVTEDGTFEVRDLSMGGLSLIAGKDYAAGELIPVEIQLPDDGGQIEMLIRVRWTTKALESGKVPMGGQIVAIREEDRGRLDAYLEAIES